MVQLQTTPTPTIATMLEALQFEFMQNALIAGVLVSIACGIVGTFVVVNRIVFISGGIAHAAYGGIGLGYFFRFNPVWGAVIFALISAMGMGWVEQRTKQRSDTLIGVLWAIGMAIGIILIDLTDGYKAGLESYLFGSLLAVPRPDLWLMLALDVIIVAVITLLYKELLAISFDRTFATTRNLPIDTLYLLLIALIALTVVMVMQIVGLIMVIALLTIPAAIAGQWRTEIKEIMFFSSLLGMVFTTLGLWFSFRFNLTSGATIILICGASYLFSIGLKTLFNSRSLSSF